MWFSQSGPAGLWAREGFPFYSFFGKPLGAPVADAVSPRPYVWTRSFAHLDVLLDIRGWNATLTWK